jgi:hypothetical protein
MALAEPLPASDTDTIKTWLQAGISAVIPGAVFRTRVVPMGTTLFYDEISKGNLRATKVAGKTCIEIEEAVRYKRNLPKTDQTAHKQPA